MSPLTRLVGTGRERRLNLVALAMFVSLPLGVFVDRGFMSVFWMAFGYFMAIA